MSTTTSKPPSCQLSRKLNAETLRSILQSEAPVEDIVEQLFLQGAELAASSHSYQYDSERDFLSQHRCGQSSLDQLEGESKIGSDWVVVLLRCPMADEVAKLYENGQPPAYFKRVIDEYMLQNPGSNAILHPGCIAHQVARQMIVKDLKIAGKTNVNYFQLACRSGATGKVVYDENGLTKLGMTKEQAAKLIDGQACLYVIVAK